MKRLKSTTVLRNDAGFSLIEVMLGVGILAVISFGMAGSLSNMHSQLRGVSQKQEILELRNLITQQLSKPGVCTWQLKNLVIDVSQPTTETSPSPTVLNLAELRMGPDASSPLLAKSGDRIPESLTGVKVTKIFFKNIYATGNPNEYKGLLQINFDANSLVVPVKPLQIQQIISTNPTDPLGAKRIDACKSGSGTVKATCATGVKRGKFPGASLGSNSIATASSVNDVFDVFEYPGGGGAWGIACKPDYVQTTCSGSELGNDINQGPDLWQLQYGRVGCFSDNEELAGSDPTLYLTCCEFHFEP